ncbi:unnamed protein product [Camellia sinensis]
MEPIGYVPVLVDEDIVLSDSFAILMYLEEKYPQHPLLPRDLQRRGINYQENLIKISYKCWVAILLDEGLVNYMEVITILVLVNDMPKESYTHHKLKCSLHKPTHFLANLVELG